MCVASAKRDINGDMTCTQRSWCNTEGTQFDISSESSEGWDDAMSSTLARLQAISLLRVLTSENGQEDLLRLDKVGLGVGCDVAKHDN